MHHLKALTFVGKALDGVPVGQLTEMGIKVAGGGATNADTTADHALGLLLASARKIVPGALCAVLLAFLSLLF